MSGPDGVIEVRQQRDGRWRWQWYATADTAQPPEPLISNEAYESREQAQESAREAFPGADVRVEDDDEDDGHPTARRRGRLLLLVATGAAGFLAGRAFGTRTTRSEGVGRARTGTGSHRVDRPGRSPSTRR